MKIKILILLPNLKPGGAERVLSFLSCSLNQELFDVKLVVFGFREDASYAISDNVIFLNKKRLLFAIPQITKSIIKFKPKIIVGSIIHINIFLGIFKMFLRNTKVVIREASVISMMSRYTNQRFMFNPIIIKFVYGQVDKIICQSNDMLKDFKSTYGLEENKLIVINNPITRKPFNFSSFSSSKLPIKFITIGRLSSEKGHFRVLKALSKINDFEFEYTIIGFGALKEEIFNQVKFLGLQNKVKYIEHTHDVYSYLNQSHLFLQGSFVEGFPNVLLESCLVGTPVLAFSCLGGTSEIIEQGVNGYIAETEDEYFDILNNPSRYLYLDNSTITMSVERKFSSEKILKEYEQMFQNLVNHDNKSKW